MASNIRDVDPSHYRKLARLPKAFSYQELKKATNDFSIKLGEGGSASVFKGCLENETPIAVKRVKWSEHGKIFFEAEVSTIASVQHINLVRLQGFCSHEIEKGGDSYIVYDLLQNGSLDTWIFSKEGRPIYQVLSWKQRYQVGIDVAKALEYLHIYCRPPIFHFDVKPANVLLDENFRAVLADFGLSVVTKEDGSHAHSFIGRGTRGYIAPEMVKNNEMSFKSDMYSFGKVLLDMFFGKLYVCLDMRGNDIYKEDGNSSAEEQVFHTFMREKLKNNEIMHLADKRLRNTVNEAEANTLVDVALRCVEYDPSRRPRDMQRVLQLLERGQQDQHEYGGTTDDTQQAEGRQTKKRKTHFETGSGSGQAPLKNLLPVTCYGPPKLIPVKCSEAFVSQQSTKHQILTALKDNQVNMVGVYGMGGVGKTTLMSQIIQDTEISSQFKNVLKVTISQNCSLEAIQTEIAEKLGMKFNDTNVTVRAMRLYARLKQAKSLIVLDDMWKELSLAEVGIPHGEDNHGCKVVMTTRSSDLCTRMDVQLSIEVKVLPRNESWELFCQNAGKDVDSNEIQSLAKTIVQECKGLPLAIIVLAKALKGKKRDLWAAALQQLKKSACKDMSTALSSIRWSYDYLESKDTKFCFLLCCLFPEDYKISMDALLMYAVGEDILADADTLAEARGRLLQIVENLISSSLLLKCDASKFMMHDIVRDAAISIASENGNNFIVKAGMGLRKWPQLKEKKDIMLRLSLMSNNISDLPDQLGCLQLVTLSLACNYNLKRVSDEFFTGMTALTTLDLSWTRISSLPQSLSALTNLRTLNLKHCHTLVDMSMLGCLRNLEILNLCGYNIRSLPEELKLLTHLKLLRLSLIGYLETIPPNVISSLSRLEELYLPLNFSNWESEEMEERKNTCLSELLSLTSLSALHMWTKDVSLLYKDPPFQWKNLKEFKIAVLDKFAYNDSINVSNYDYIDESNFSNGNGLWITSVDISSIAEWVRGLWGTNDLELHVRKSRGIPYVIPVLHSSFNNLKILEISDCVNMEYLVKTEEIGEQAILMELEELKLTSLSDMKRICSNGPLPIGSFNKLKSLVVEGCDELINVFPVSMAESLPQLESLQIKYCNEMVQIFGSEEEGSSQPPKIKAVFSQLQTLELENLPNLSRFSSQSSVIFSFPSLENVEIYLCPNLTRVPLGPESAPKLKKINSSCRWQYGEDQSFFEVYYEEELLFLEVERQEVQGEEVEPMCKLRMGSFLSL